MHDDDMTKLLVLLNTRGVTVSSPLKHLKPQVK
jgi:hypothetical protein